MDELFEEEGDFICALMSNAGYPEAEINEMAERLWTSSHWYSKTKPPKIDWSPYD